MTHGPYDLYLAMLFVDQGMGHLLTVTNAGSKVPLSNMLMDLGSARPDRTGETVDFVFNTITSGGSAVLDLITISHEDDDHWSLIVPLLEKVDAAGKVFSLKQLRWGGYNTDYANVAYSGQSRTVLEHLNDLLTVKIAHLSGYDAESSAYSAKSLPYILKSPGGDLKIVPVAVNARSGNKTHRANTSSLVLSILYATGGVPAGYDESFLLPGDSTKDTLLFIQPLLKLKNFSEVTQPRMLGLPHHGSLTTIANNYSASDPKLDLAIEFADAISPYTVGASAGFETYHHPHAEVFKLFDKSVWKGADVHSFVYFSRLKDAWTTNLPKSGRYGMYSTYTSVGSDNKAFGADRRRIVFKIEADSTFKVILLPLSSHTLASVAPMAAGRPRRRAVRAMPASARA